MHLIILDFSWPKTISYISYYTIESTNWNSQLFQKFTYPSLNILYSHLWHQLQSVIFQYSFSWLSQQVFHPIPHNKTSPTQPNLLVFRECTANFRSPHNASIIHRSGDCEGPLEDLHFLVRATGGQLYLLSQQFLLRLGHILRIFALLQHPVSSHL